MNLLISVVVLFLVGLELSMGDRLWRSVVVDEEPFNQTFSKCLPNVEIITSVIRASICGAICDSRGSSCRIWCHKTSSQECWLSQIFVSPLHQPLTTNVISCFTSVRKDLLGNKPITMSHPLKSSNDIGNLIHRTLYNYNIKTCSYTRLPVDDLVTLPWYLVDLQQEESISEVRIVRSTCWRSVRKHFPDGAYVKTGLSAPPTDGNFSSFKYFGTIPTQHGLLVEDDEYVVRSPNPVRARYVAISVDDLERNDLELCFIQIFN